MAECSGNPYGPGCAGPRGERGHRGCITRAGEAPAATLPAVFPLWRIPVFGGEPERGVPKGGKLRGGGDVVRCARRASSVRMAGQLSMGLDRRRQRSGRNFEAGPMAVTVTALAARHFRSRRPSSQQASVLRRLEGHDEPRCGRSLQLGGGMPLQRHERSRWFARVNEPAQLGRVAVVT